MRNNNKNYYIILNAIKMLLAKIKNIPAKHAKTYVTDLQTSHIYGNKCALVEI